MIKNFIKISLLVAGILAAASCQRDELAEVMVRRPSGAPRSASVSKTSSPVSFTTRSATPLVHMPDYFSFSGFHFLVQNTTSPTTWYTQLGSRAEWETPGDVNTAFVPTDNTSFSWPMEDSQHAQHLNFFAAAYNEDEYLKWEDYDPSDNWNTVSPDDYEFIFKGYELEDDGIGGYVSMPRYYSYTEYDNSFKYGENKGWWLWKDDAGNGKVTLTNPFNATDFVVGNAVDQGPKTTVPMNFTHALARIESVTIDYGSYRTWVQERGVDLSEMVIVSYEFNDPAEATYTFNPNGSPVLVQENHDWTSEGNWFMPSVYTQYYMETVALDPGDPEPANYRNWVLRTSLLSGTPFLTPANGDGSEWYCTNPGDLDMFDIAYTELPMTGSGDASVLYRFGSPIRSRMSGATTDMLECTEAQLAANPHYFGHPMIFPGKHKIRIKLLRLLESTSAFETDPSGPAIDMVGYYQYPAKLYTLEGTFTVTAGSTNNLLVSINPDNNLLDVYVDATMDGWSVSTGDVSL